MKRIVLENIYFVNFVEAYKYVEGNKDMFGKISLKYDGDQYDGKCEIFFKLAVNRSDIMKILDTLV